MLPEMKEVNGAKVLCEHVSWILSSRDELDRYFVIFNALAYVMSMCLVLHSWTGFDLIKIKP